MMKVITGLFLVCATLAGTAGTARATWPEVKDQVRSEKTNILGLVRVAGAQNGFVYTADIDSNVDGCGDLRWEQWIKGSVTLTYEDDSTLVLDMCRDVVKATSEANQWCDDVIGDQKKGPKDVNETKSGHKNFRCHKDEYDHLQYTFEDAPGREVGLGQPDPKNGNKKLASAVFDIEVEQKLWYKFDGKWEYFWSAVIRLDGKKAIGEDSRDATITYQGRRQPAKKNED